MKRPSPELRRSFEKWLEENTPPGTRLQISTSSYPSFWVACDGEDSDFAY